LSSLAHAGGSTEERAAQAFIRGADATGLRGLEFQPPEKARLSDLSEAVDRLARIKPKSKRRVAEAIAVTVAHDGVVTTTEAELLRGIADALGCPMPPLIGAATSA